MMRYNPKISDVVIIKDVHGRAIPIKPWPQAFYVSGVFLSHDVFELRPLTITGLIKGLGKNLITMTWWRCCWGLRWLGFLSTDQGSLMSWRDLTWRFWKYGFWR